MRRRHAFDRAERLRELERILASHEDHFSEVIKDLWMEYREWISSEEVDLQDYSKSISSMSQLTQELQKWITLLAGNVSEQKSLLKRMDY